MKFLPSISSLSKEELILVIHLDVGEDRARGALLYFGRKEMLYTTSLKERLGGKRSEKATTSARTSTREVLEEVVAFIKTEAGLGNHYRLGKIYVILSAPYYLSHTANIKYSDPNPFTITPDLVADLVRSHKESIDLDKHPDIEVGKNPEIIAERIIDIKVNGYHAVNPYGKKGKSIDVSVFKTEVDPKLVSSIESEVRKHFSAPIYFEPLSLAVYIALRNSVNFNPSFLFIVVGNEVTEISLVRNNSLLETVSFPFGKHSLVRHLSRDLKVPETMVLDALMLYNRESFHDAEKKKIESALGRGAEQWFTFFERAIVSLSEQSTVPPTAYVVADLGVQNVFKSFIEVDRFANQSFTPAGFSVNVVDTEKAKSLIEFKERASCDVILCLEGLFALSTKIPLPRRE